MNELIPALIIAIVLMVWLPMFPREKTWARVAVLGFALILTTRYLFWRITETLPAFELSIQPVWGWVFFIFEISAIVGLFVGHFFQMRTVNRSNEADQSAAKLKLSDDIPAVDVFITTYNEGLDVVERTIVAALSLDYPNFTVWVLDDGKREWLRKFCEDKGANYLTRSKNEHAKAGNINHGLAVSKLSSDADLVMVLDADFVVRADFLWRTVGFFEDEKIGIVQTPQHFFNPDPIQSNLLADQLWVDEQRYFFDIVQPSRDAWDVAFCCGTSSVIRRSYLEEIGGFPTDSVTEDILLSFVFLQHGYITRYLDERLSIGLAPEGLKEYLTQRSRWCLGTMQILWLKSCPLWAPGLTVLQRTSFLWQVMNWLVTFPWAIIVLMAPLLYLFFGLYAIEAQASELINHMAPAFVAILMSVNWVSNRKYLIIMTDATRLIMVFTILGSLYQSLTRPFGQRFKVTAKGGDRNKVIIQWSLLWKLILLLALSVLGIALNLVPEYAVIEDHEQQWMNFIWCFFNIVVIAISAMICIDLPRPRREERFVVNENSVIVVEDKKHPCLIKDLSLSGANIQTPLQGLPISHRLMLNVVGVGVMKCQISRIISPYEIGVEFIDLSSKRDAMIRKVYTSNYTNVSYYAYPGKLFLSILYRFFGHK